MVVAWAVYFTLLPAFVYVLKCICRKLKRNLSVLRGNDHASACTLGQGLSGPGRMRGRKGVEGVRDGKTQHQSLWPALEFNQELSLLLIPTDIGLTGVHPGQPFQGATGHVSAWLCPSSHLAPMSSPGRPW